MEEEYMKEKKKKISVYSLELSATIKMVILLTKTST